MCFGSQISGKKPGVISTSSAQDDKETGGCPIENGKPES